MRALACPHSSNATLRALSESLKVRSVFGKCHSGCCGERYLGRPSKTPLATGSTEKTLGQPA